MKELVMNDKATKDFFVHVFREKNLIPILGSGFSRGFSTFKGGKVPSGTDLKEYMIDKICSVKKYSLEELRKESFSSVAQSFERYFSDPSSEGIKDYFINNYTRVKINKPQQIRFLNEIDWDYIYTLNIDTAIEDTPNGKWEVFYPNKKFDDRVVRDGYRKLYKIHGDVNAFCKNLSYDEMILTENQYIRSLESNGQFHELLSADCGNKNLLYIGCSLDDEIDIKYSVISDENRNVKDRETRGIYVTAEKLSEHKKEKLEEFNISHIIQLENVNEYEIFYEFVVECYQESCQDRISNIHQYEFRISEKLGPERDKNIEFLADVAPRKGIVPFYYTPLSICDEIKLVKNKVNVIIGRRFVGKSMLAYSILEKHPNFSRYYISENDELSYEDLKTIVNQDNSLIVFDSDALDDRSFGYVINEFEEEKNNIVCVFLNSYTDIINILSSYPNMINYAFDKKMDGKIRKDDLSIINSKLNELGIAIFSENQNILDNTLRIANVYNKRILGNYVINNVEEIELIIWLLVKSKIYYEEIVTLGLVRSYKKIVNKYAPFLQEEHCKKGEMKRHSHVKVICNGKLGLLQILNAYVYPPKTAIEEAVYHIRQKNVCDAIYNILSSFEKMDSDIVKPFLMFDTLNDIFSRAYSKISIDFLVSGGKSGKKQLGASSMIHEIYNNENIMKLKSRDPNYWLQRAKSIYMTNYRHKGSQWELLEAVNWAKKAEEDSRLRIEAGEMKYLRTESNSIMQLAMLYGKLARLRNYEDLEVNDEALKYYYASLSDSNNINAIKTLMYNSKGTDDFNNFVNNLMMNSGNFTDSLKRERDYLVSINVKGEILYRI